MEPQEIADSLIRQVLDGDKHQVELVASKINLLRESGLLQDNAHHYRVATDSEEQLHC